MSFLKSTVDLKKEVLTVCGELTDGTSSFETIVVQYLNDVYQGVLAGGNEFGVEVAEPWVWAQSKRPILLSLQPAYSGAATLTQDSASGTFSVAPTSSLAGRYFRVDSRADLYRIATHTASSTAFTLDQPYLETGGSLNFMAFKLDYDVVDDTIIVDSTNNKLDFVESGTTVLTSTLTTGVYTPTTLCTEIVTRMQATGTKTYTCTFDSVTRKFTIATSNGTIFKLMFASGSNAANSSSIILGFDIEDQTGSLTYTSGYSLSGVLRPTKPITMYRESPSYMTSAKDVGKIFMIDDNTFLREYPLNRLTQAVPDKFCPIEVGPTGLWKIRVCSSVLDEPIRAEFNHIPVQRKLVDNSASYPLIPGSYSKFLVYGAAHFLMLDKSDSRADQYFKLAATKLVAMLNDNRKGTALAGQNFGKLIARKGQMKISGWFR